MTDRHIILAVVVAATTLVATYGACAQSYPEKRILLVVGFGAGGMTDVTSRMLGRQIERTLGVPVIIENKPGAGGMLAINSVGQMPADGYTMVSIQANGPFTSAYQGKPINLDEWAIIGGYMPQERVVFAEDVQQQMKAIDLTPAWIDPKAYEATLRNVVEDADKLREYLKK